MRSSMATVVGALLVVVPALALPRLTHPRLALRVALGTHHTQPVKEGAVIVAPQQNGYLVCDAPSLPDQPAEHLWDYHIQWETPQRVKRNAHVFEVGGEYQMPHASLVLMGFSEDLQGDYTCMLHHRNALLASSTLTLALPPPSTPDETPSSASIPEILVEEQTSNSVDSLNLESSSDVFIVNETNAPRNPAATTVPLPGETLTNRETTTGQEVASKAATTASSDLSNAIEVFQS